ncbi:DUF6893 family small protein [Streptomyces sp. NPDC057011]
MKKSLIGGVTAAVLAAVLLEVFPDLKRYLRMVRM